MDTNITFQLTVSTVWFEACSIEQFDTKEEAAAVLATLPKQLRARVCYAAIDNSAKCGTHTVRYKINCEARLSSTKNNERNETGIKRLHKLVTTQKIEYYKPRNWVNVYDTLEEALAAVAL
jgi:hypothetical protein